MNQSRILLVEGWRGIPHSYAIVNQFQCLQLLRQPNLTLRHHDAPFYNPGWRAVQGLFPVEAESALAGIPPLQADEVPDAVFRIAFPYNISPSIARRTLVFGTSEFCCVPDSCITGARSLLRACQESDAIIITPSNWSREGFVRSGAPPQRVKVVPHGVDPTLLHPIDPQQREELRRQSGWEGFVFLTLGAMSGNKGIGHLLKAFAIVARRYPHARLVIKGLGAIYQSRQTLQTELNKLSQTDLAVVQTRMAFLEHTLNFDGIARLYQLADAYVAPYSAEGFNLPVLEALASGLPVICTRGGATDDFVNDELALRINARRVAVQEEPGSSGFGLAIDFDHLVHQMMTIIELPAFTQQVRTLGPALVAQQYTWAHVTGKLLALLFDQT